MDWQDIKIILLGAAVMISYGAAVLSLASESPFGAVIFGCLAMLLTVKWVNDRQDPRHAKRPPDAP